MAIATGSKSEATGAPERADDARGLYNELQNTSARTIGARGELTKEGTRQTGRAGTRNGCNKQLPQLPRRPPLKKKTSATTRRARKVQESGKEVKRGGKRGRKESRAIGTAKAWAPATRWTGDDGKRTKQQAQHAATRSDLKRTR